MTQQENELTTGADERQLLLTEVKEVMPRKKRGRGRPKGSKNKPKLFTPMTEGWKTEGASEAQPVAKPRSGIYRKWQREWIKPQFALSRKEAYDLFLNYLRSVAGKPALKELIVEGSVGVGKLSDSALGKYLEQTNLLSRYPHEVVIKN